ncbi:MAG: diguanylate cyclase [Sulfuricurvum sp.]|nr:diguanylate cyclase [Sulfuricurvum sp.]
MFRLHLYFPLLLSLLIASIITGVSVIYVQEKNIHKSKENISHQYTKFIHQKVKYDADVLSEYINFIQTDTTLVSGFKQGNKKEIYDAMHETYARLRKNIDLTHMYFIKTDGTVLLRVHDFEKDGDTIDRATFKKAKETQKLVYGLEFGVKMNYTLRVVKPWYVNGELIGYVELGKEIDKIITDYANLLDAHVYLAVKDEVYKNASDSVKLSPKNLIGHYYIAYNTYGIPAQMGAILSHAIDHTDITFNKRSYYVSKMKFSDFSQKELGYVIFLQDVSMEHKIMYGSIKVLIGVLIALSSLFFILGYTLIKKKEKNINDLTSTLHEQKEELSRYNQKLQKLFDLQKNMIILTDGKLLKMGNRTLFSFFGFEDLDHFLKQYNCICERFIVDDTFFHLGKVPQDKIWVDVVKTLLPENRIVAISDKEGIAHVFSISLNEFEADNYVIAFTDISNTMRDQIKLIQKVTHDKLTGAFNREFLDNSIQDIIRDTEPKQLGIIMSDIDYFKRVNDTYGHNRGDEVLKQFVRTIQKSIRNEDYVIRWGGEEFIILMRMDSIESLRISAEHIRIAVENAHFKEVEKMTASFGVTLYKRGEKFSVTIARADKALYMAKANGRNQVHLVES